MIRPLVLCSLLAACGGSQPPATYTPPPAGASDVEVGNFFRAQIQACNDYNVKVGNQPAGSKLFDGGPADPSRSLKIVHRQPGGATLVEDAAGTELIIDVAHKTISAPGAHGMVPLAYKTCPPDVFVGSSDD